MLKVKLDVNYAQDLESDLLPCEATQQQEQSLDHTQHRQLQLARCPFGLSALTWPDAKDAAYSKVCSNNAAAIQRIKGYLQAAEAT